MSKRLDNIDRKILGLLQHSGRVKRIKIADEVGLSVPSVSDRMRKLRESNLIEGYHAVLDAKQLGYDITAFIRVSVDKSSRYGPMIEHVCACEEVLEVHSITSEGSHMLKVRTENTSTLEALLSRIQSFPGVTSTYTSIVLSTFKETRQLPLTPDG